MDMDAMKSAGSTGSLGGISSLPQGLSSQNLIEGGRHNLNP